MFKEVRANLETVLNQPPFKKPQFLTTSADSSWMNQLNSVCRMFLFKSVPQRNLQPAPC